MTAFIDILRQERVIVVIRDAQPATLGSLLDALYGGGLRLFEVTMEAPNALDAFASVRDQLPQDVLLGAGTVLDAETAAQAIAAGAQFVVSPILLKDISDVAYAHSVPCMLGGMTPTEIYTAYRYGCVAVKVFPASTVGPNFLRELRGPLGFIPLYPTGGITLENAPAFLEAGAVALGVGSALVNKEWVQRGDWAALRQEVSQWAKLKQSIAKIGE